VATRRDRRVPPRVSARERDRRPPRWRAGLGVAGSVVTSPARALLAETRRAVTVNRKRVRQTARSQNSHAQATETALRRSLGRGRLRKMRRARPSAPTAARERVRIAHRPSSSRAAAGGARPTAAGRHDATPVVGRRAPPSPPHTRSPRRRHALSLRPSGHADRRGLRAPRGDDRRRTPRRLRRAERADGQPCQTAWSTTLRSRPRCPTRQGLRRPPDVHARWLLAVEDLPGGQVAAVTLAAVGSGCDVRLAAHGAGGVDDDKQRCAACGGDAPDADRVDDLVRCAGARSPSEAPPKWPGFPGREPASAPRATSS